MDITTKKAAAIIARMIDKKVAEFEQKVEALRKEFSDRFSVIEKVVEELSQKGVGVKGDFATRGELKSISKEIASRYEEFQGFKDEITKRFGGLEKEFQDVKQKVFDFLQEARSITDEAQRNIEIQKEKNKEVDSFLKEFVKKTRETIELSKKLDRQITLFEGEINAKVESLRKSVTSLEKKAAKKKDVRKMLGDLKKDVSLQLQKAFIELGKKKDEMEKEIGGFEERLNALEKSMANYAQIKDLNEVRRELRSLKGVEKAKESLEKRASQLEKRIAVYDYNVRNTLNNVKAFSNTIQSMLSRLSRLETDLSGLRYSLERLSSFQEEVKKDILSMRGKLSVLEQYFADPDKWLGEKFNKWMEEASRDIRLRLEGLERSLMNQRTELYNQMLILSLTRISNAGDMEHIVSETRALEYLMKGMKEAGTLAEEMKNYVLDVLSSVRDFWESKNVNVSAFVENAMEKLKEI